MSPPGLRCGDGLPRPPGDQLLFKGGFWVQPQPHVVYVAADLDAVLRITGRIIERAAALPGKRVRRETLRGTGRRTPIIMRFQAALTHLGRNH